MTARLHAGAGPARPLLSVTEAAAATGKSRRTISRLLDAGRLDGAHRDEQTGTWQIPPAALAAAGLRLHAPTPPDAPVVPVVPTDAPVGTPTPLPALPAALAELADWRRRAEVAEAIAAERAVTIDALQTSLRMLTTGSADPDALPRRRWRMRR